MESGDPSCSTRHAVILAAGESTRTRPLTLHRPKPLIPLLGQPLLAHILDQLVGLVDQATLVVGYRADMVEAAFGASYRGIRLHYALQRVVNGTAGALLAAAPLDAPFFLLYGDNLVARADLLGVCRGRYGVAGLRVPDARAFGVLQITGGSVHGIIEKSPNPPPGALANPGIYQFDGAVFPLLEQIKPSPRGELELTDLIGALAAQHPILPHVCTGFWIPVGNPWEALVAALFLLEQRANQFAQVSDQAEIMDGCEIEGPVTILGRARIEANAKVSGPTIIGDGCVVGEHALVTRAALEPGARLGAGAMVAHSVIGAGATIGAGAQVRYSWVDDGAVVGAGADLEADRFEDVQSAAETRDRLARDELITRGAVLGRGARVPDGARTAPGTVVFE